jgi:Tfp pilus assembly protein PilZ
MRTEAKPAPRWPYRAPVVYETATMRAEGQLSNVSERGMFVRTRMAPRSGDAVRLQILDAQSSIQIEGSIRWVGTLDRHLGFGVQIAEPADSYSELVRRVAFSQQLKPGPAD